MPALTKDKILYDRHDLELYVDPNGHHLPTIALPAGSCMKSGFLRFFISTFAPSKRCSMKYTSVWIPHVNIQSKDDLTAYHSQGPNL